MANPAKAKGDAAEREAVETLKLFCPELLVDNPWRMMGAGRRDDIGDLRVFDDVAVQVRAYAANNLGVAVRSSASDSHVQAKRAGQTWGLGMVPIPHRPRLDPEAVRWLACTTVDDWPDADLQRGWAFGSVSKLLGWLNMAPTTARPDILGSTRRSVVDGLGFWRRAESAI